MEIETRMMDAAQIVSKKMAFIVMEFQVLVLLSVWTESLQEMKLVKTMILILQMVVQVHAKQFQDGFVIQLFQYQVAPLHVEMVFEIPQSFVMIRLLQDVCLLVKAHNLDGFAIQLAWEMFVKKTVETQ